MQVSEQITRKSASNLALAFVLLPREKRQEMVALYAFCREVDDVADEESVPAETRRAQLREWRADIRLACEAAAPKFPVNQELKPVIATRHLKFELFDELIKGVEMDLDITRYETMEHLEQYCYRVASVVGLLSIEIFGYKNPACREYAVCLGKALQLTNILRDVKNDAQRGRIYLPLEELRKFGVSQQDILDARYSANYRQLAESISARARDFYKAAWETLPAEDARNMATAELMGSVYWKLLLKLHNKGYNVFGDRLTKLTRAQKLFLIMRMWFKVAIGSGMPNYGVR